MAVVPVLVCEKLVQGGFYNAVTGLNVSLRNFYQEKEELRKVARDQPTCLG